MGGNCSANRQTRRPLFLRLRRVDRLLAETDDEDDTSRGVTPDRSGEEMHNPSAYDLPFENLIFEGGGNKGLAYIGAIKYLEDAGLMSQIRRLAGCSYGAIVAAALTMGYTSEKLTEVLRNKLSPKVVFDHGCGQCSFVPNVVRHYGWNPGNRVGDMLTKEIEDTMGDPDITFAEMRRLTGKELCVVVTNLNYHTVEYCHPKTTPDMPVRLALRMSMSVPGVFQPVPFTRYGRTDLYVDGGLLLNYPINCFDGWYLSMEPEDNFFRHQMPLDITHESGWFAVRNIKTLGFLLYSEAEVDLYKCEFDRRPGALHPRRPKTNTRTYRRYLKRMRKKKKAAEISVKLEEAMRRFLFVLHKHSDAADVIDRRQLEAALKDDMFFTPSQRELLFGGCGASEVFERLDKNSNGQVHYHDLVTFVEEAGIEVKSRHMGVDRAEITSAVQYFSGLMQTMSVNLKKSSFKADDVTRTVGINTSYVGTMDFKLEDPDYTFLVARGYNSTKAFIQDYIVNQHPPKKGSSLMTHLSRHLMVTPTGNVFRKRSKIRTTFAPRKSCNC